MGCGEKNFIIKDEIQLSLVISLSLTGRLKQTRPPDRSLGGSGGGGTLAGNDWA